MRYDLNFEAHPRIRHFLHEALKRPEAKRIGLKIDKIASHVEKSRAQFSWARTRNAASEEIVIGRTVIELNYDSNKGAWIAIRLCDAHGETTALFARATILTALLPETILGVIQDMPLSHILDLAAYEQHGAGCEMLLDGVIARAGRQFGRTCLKRKIPFDWETSMIEADDLLKMAGAKPPRTQQLAICA